MEIEHTFWFSEMGTDGIIGVVVGKDLVTGKHKAYIGTAAGIAEAADALHIASRGSPVNLQILKEIAGHLEEPVVKIVGVKFKVGDEVEVVRLLDTLTDQGLIGFTGKVTEVDPLPNGDFNYYVDGHYMHEAELEYHGCNLCGDALGKIYSEITNDLTHAVILWDKEARVPRVFKPGDRLCGTCAKIVEHYKRSDLHRQY